jgi:alcohol dehydrogenase class IV
MINENLDLTKAELKKLVKDVFDEEFKKNKEKPLTEKDIKDIVREMFRNHYKTLWQKSNLFLTSM